MRERNTFTQFPSTCKVASFRSAISEANLQGQQDSQEGQLKKCTGRSNWILHLEYIEAFGMLFGRCYSQNRMGSIIQHTEYFDFRCKIQLDHPVEADLFRKVPDEA